MSVRLLLEIALRVLGIWFFLDSIPALMSITSLVLSGTLSFGTFGQTDYILLNGLTVIARMLLGGGLVFSAPSLAVWFYPQDSQGEEFRTAVGPGDIYRTACFVLGAYLLVAAARPAGLLIGGVMTGDGRTGHLVANAVTVVVHIVSGLLLVFGSRPIADLLSGLKYDPQSIPKQQFSLVMLLILLGLIAVILGVARRLSLGT